MEHRNPIPTVDAIIEKDGKIVLIRRGIEPFKGKLAIPGGHVEYGETVEQAVKREAKEETDLEIKLKVILGVYSNPKRDPRGQRISTVFIAEYASGELEAKSDADEVNLYDPKELNEEDLAFDHYKIIQDYLKYKEKKETL